MKKSTTSWDLAIFKSHESFSPFLPIFWDSSRVVQTPPPPREVLLISWDLQTKKYYVDIFTVWKKSNISCDNTISNQKFQKFSRPHPVHEMLSPSRGNYRLKRIMWTWFWQCWRNQISPVIKLFQIKEAFLSIPPNLTGNKIILHDTHPSMRMSPHLISWEWQIKDL